MLNNKLTPTSLLFIISGPAGSGKTTLCDAMLKTLSPQVRRVITATTRAPREGETHGKDYYFFSPEAFQEGIKKGSFYEYANVHDNLYGTLKAEIQQKLSENLDLLINIDVQGAETLRKSAQEDPLLKDRVVSVFIMPESIDQIQQRLQKRNQDSEETIKKRLQIAEQEVTHWQKYNYCIPSGNEEEDFACLMSLYAAEKLRVRPPKK